ncbi:putative aldouronate transport system substrate-binding protein [Paenibacillus sp. UNCCL117]|uniref:extracellular solute-binding protein n=1 Tax=unclassified Paenibacillus TaxID=185978 RepID=UPI000884BFCC|nr:MULTISPECIES: extracellular solute-binding protein [unclassified Paenibacillus]SDD41981.1 putative aldouronate transport system substrate-binding protein [Paenibacillus sp. cl123]SFW47717.1 putative aldouronate transport system substrate-binding protein [Paenibacillus sp. UNCCL117]
MTKRSNLKAFIALSAALSLTGTVVGCSSGSGEQPAGETPKPTGQQTGSDKKLAISYLDGTYASPIPPADGPGVKMINEKFNIDFKTEFVPFSEYSQKLPVRMASGDIPDIVGMEGADSNYFKWAKQGAFLPLDDYIDKYPTLKMVPQFVWDAMKVDGKVYGIPRYFPVKYGKQAMIRKDWLDKLGLKMPTNFEELKQVAIAFAKNDPDGNGKDDTYGLMLGKGIQYDFDFGAYWHPQAWYHEKDGQLIPGIVADASKERIQMLADLYQAGAIPKDWAVSKISDVKKAFYAGKFGIFYEQAYDKWPTDFKTLAEINPGAELVPIPPFKAPDGSQGFMGLSGYYQIFTLSAKMKGDNDKIMRILDMNEYFRKFVPVSERTASNADFDWLYGKEGVGYKLNNGVVENADFGTGSQPRFYFETRYWAPNDEANEISKVAIHPLQKSFFQASEEMLKQTKSYINPINRVKSAKFMEKWSELELMVRDEQTKMIVGQTKIADWDKMVQQFMSKGGKDVIDEVNKLMKDSNIKGEWH